MEGAWPDEFLRELNFKARLIRQTETLKKSDNVKYSKLVEKYKAGHQHLWQLPIKELKALVAEI